MQARPKANPLVRATLAVTSANGMETGRFLSVAPRGLTRSTRSHPMKASASNRTIAMIGIDIGKNTFHPGKLSQSG
jgi:hypothetical protein